MKIISIILCIFFISGCAGNIKLTRDEKGRITEIKALGPIKASGKSDKVEWAVDNKTESPFKEAIPVSGQRIIEK